jgi:hypothetical protein
VNQIDKIDRELVTLSRYSEGGATLILDLVVSTGQKLISEVEGLIKELKTIKLPLKKPQADGDKEESKKEPENDDADSQQKLFDEFKEQFRGTFHRLSNFLAIYSRYVRETKIRSSWFKKGGLKLLMSAFSLHQVFGHDFGTVQSGLVDRFFGLVNSDIENGETDFVTHLEDQIQEELEKIKEVFKCKELSDLNDFSALINNDFPQLI